MDVLIKGERIELPKIGESYIDIRIYETGEIVIEGDQDKTAEAIELPPHGDLIERSPLVQKIKDEWQKIHEETGCDVKGIFWNKLVEIIESSEVVLEAST